MKKSRKIAHPGGRETPRQLLAISVISIIATEMLVIYIYKMLGIPDAFSLLGYPALLLFFLLPILYYLVYRPLTDTLTTHNETEEHLRIEQNVLEQRINERTSELAQKNDSLMREITDRTNLSNELQEKSEFLKIVIDSLHHPFYVIDAKTYEIKLANKAANFGDFPEGAKCYKLTHGLDQPCNSKHHPCCLSQVIETKKPIMMEHVHLDKDGNPKLVEVHAHPIFDSAGKVIDVVEFVMEKPEEPETQPGPTFI